ncbi:HET-domain-containing protein, partial [Tothia fuscella]
MAKIFKGLKTNIGYYPLDDASAEIRLLELLPSGTTSVEKSPQIQCRLAHVSLDDESEYTALSYVWGQRGSSHFPSSVLSEIRVTSNLEAALKHIRKESESVMLWVDAICIDQTNNQEKNIQVGRMGSIFEKAMETIVWLGPAADESDLLLEIFEETLPDARLMDMKTKSVATEVARAVAFPSQAAAALFRREWWSRVWVLQEFI